MAIETEKLVEFLKNPIYGNRSSSTVTQDEAEEIQDKLKDDASEESQMSRKLSYGVGYMELAETGGAFSCANCKYLASDGICLQIDVRAPVSAEYGCCNKFYPTGIDITFPPDGAVRSDRSELAVSSY